MVMYSHGRIQEESSGGRTTTLLEIVFLLISCRSWSKMCKQEPGNPLLKISGYTPALYSRRCYLSYHDFSACCVVFLSSSPILHHIGHCYITCEMEIMIFVYLYVPCLEQLMYSILQTRSIHSWLTGNAQCTLDSRIWQINMFKILIYSFHEIHVARYFTSKV